MLLIMVLQLLLWVQDSRWYFESVLLPVISCSDAESSFQSMLVLSSAHISGGHLNPAVTAGCVFERAIFSACTSANANLTASQFDICN